MSKKFKVLDNNKKNFTKNEIADRKEVERLAADGFDPMQITPPNHLNSIAKQEYKRVIEDVQKLPLRNLDRAMLESYCLWYSVFKETSLKLREEGMIIVEDEYSIEHPLVKTLEKATKNIRSTASELGLTVDSRLRIYVPKVEEKKETLKDLFG